MPRRPRPVYAFGPDGRLAREYRTFCEAASTEGVSIRQMYKAIRLKTEIKGFGFSFTPAGLYHSDELFDVDRWAEMMKV